MQTLTSLKFLLQKTFELRNMIILELGIGIVESCIAKQRLGNKQIKSPTVVRLFNAEQDKD